MYMYVCLCIRACTYMHIYIYIDNGKYSPASGTPRLPRKTNHRRRNLKAFEKHARTHVSYCCVAEQY